MLIVDLSVFSMEAFSSTETGTGGARTRLFSRTPSLAEFPPLLHEARAPPPRPHTRRAKARARTRARAHTHPHSCGNVVVGRDFPLADSLAEYSQRVKILEMQQCGQSIRRLKVAMNACNFRWSGGNVATEAAKNVFEVLCQELQSYHDHVAILALFIKRFFKPSELLTNFDKFHFPCLRFEVCGKR